MKNFKLWKLTKLLFIILVIWTIFILFAAYTKTINSFTGQVINGYIVYIYCFLVYIVLTTIFNLKNLAWSASRKKLFRFVALFVFFGASNYFFDYIFRPSNINLLREFSTAFGAAFGIFFIDVLLSKKKEN